MDISWEGVLFLWVLFLWPVLLGGFYLVWKKGVITNKGRFFLVSVAAGYAVLVIGNFLGPALLFGVLKATGTTVVSPDAEPIVNMLTAVITATLFLLPVGCTHYIAKRFS